MATVKLLRAGKYRRRFDSYGDGLLDVYYVSDLDTDAVESKSQVATIVEAHLDANNLRTKFGVNLAGIDTVRVSVSKAMVHVTYGRIGGGGYVLPTIYSSLATRTDTLNIPVFYKVSGDDQQWKARWYAYPRSVGLFRWNTRVEGATLAAKRVEFNTYRGMLKDLPGYGLSRLIDGGYVLLPSNEIRFELVFEQPSPVPEYTFQEIGNWIQVPALGVGDQYIADDDMERGPFVNVFAYTEQHQTMPDNAFLWVNFST